MMTKVVLGVVSLFIAFYPSISFPQTANNDILSDNSNYTTVTVTSVHTMPSATSLSDFSSSLNSTAETINESSMTTNATVTTSSNSSEETTTSPNIEGHPSIIPVTNSVQTHSAVSNISHSDDDTTTISSNETSNISVVSVDTKIMKDKSASTAFTPASTTAAAFHVPENCSTYKVSFAVCKFFWIIPVKCWTFHICEIYISLANGNTHLQILQLLDDQPKHLPSASIKKCCPLHQTFTYDYGLKRCTDRNNTKFDVKAISARFYENCIEDMESNFTIGVKVENNCKK